tara:strand:+ start:1347 stop:1910 length:564 start_codon:yes stop_codon:yes gene_type:complete
MTSSIVQGPNSSTPYTQHNRARRPGFGEVRLATNNNALYPTLVNYVDSKIISETSQLQKQSTTTRTDMSAPIITVLGNTTLLDGVLGGLVVINSSSTINSDINDGITWPTNQVKAAFKSYFGRDARLGDGWTFTIVNNSQGTIYLKGGDNELSVAAIIKKTQISTKLMYFSSADDYDVVDINFTILP